MIDFLRALEELWHTKKDWHWLSLAYAMYAHRGQEYGEGPYWKHLLKVADYGYDMGVSPSVAFLHDLLEDTKVSSSVLAHTKREGPCTDLNQGQDRTVLLVHKPYLRQWVGCGSSQDSRQLSEHRSFCLWNRQTREIPESANHAVSSIQ